MYRMERMTPCRTILGRGASKCITAVKDSSWWRCSWRWSIFACCCLCTSGSCWGRGLTMLKNLRLQAAIVLLTINDLLKNRGLPEVLLLTFTLHQPDGDTFTFSGLNSIVSWDFTCVGRCCMCVLGDATAVAGLSCLITITVGFCALFTFVPVFFSLNCLLSASETNKPNVPVKSPCDSRERNQSRKLAFFSSKLFFALCDWKGTSHKPKPSSYLHRAQLLLLSLLFAKHSSGGENCHGARPSKL